MPCLVLTTDCVAAFQYDLQSGILFTDKSCVRLYWDLFRKCRQFCTSFIQTYPVEAASLTLFDQMKDIYIKQFGYVNEEI